MFVRARSRERERRLQFSPSSPTEARSPASSVLPQISPELSRVEPTSRLEFQFRELLPPFDFIPTLRVCACILCIRACPQSAVKRMMYARWKLPSFGEVRRPPHFLCRLQGSFGFLSFLLSLQGGFGAHERGRDRPRPRSQLLLFRFIHQMAQRTKD